MCVRANLAVLGLIFLTLMSGCSGLGIGGTTGGDGMIHITVMEKDSDIDGTIQYEDSQLAQIESVNSSVNTLIRDLEQTGNETADSSVELSQREVQAVKDELAEMERKNPVGENHPRGKYYSTGEYYIVVELAIYS